MSLATCLFERRQQDDSWVTIQQSRIRQRANRRKRGYGPDFPQMARHSVTLVAIARCTAGITGPSFLIGAVAAALIESGRWLAELSIVWSVVLLGAGIAFVVEWRTVGRNGSSSACVP